MNDGGGLIAPDLPRVQALIAMMKTILFLTAFAYLFAIVLFF